MAAGFFFLPICRGSSYNCMLILQIFCAQNTLSYCVTAEPLVRHRRFDWLPRESCSWVETRSSVALTSPHTGCSDELSLPELLSQRLPSTGPYTEYGRFKHRVDTASAQLPSSQVKTLKAYCWRTHCPFRPSYVLSGPII